MIHRGTWSAPANVLIAGEYAITREGGVGLAVAVEPRGVVHLYEYDEQDEPTRGAVAGPRLAVGGNTTMTVAARMGGPESGVTGEVRGATALPLVEAVAEFVVAGPGRKAGAVGDAGGERASRSAGVGAQASVERGPGRGAGGARARHWHVEIDTSAFFNPHTGKKRGLGSSAVATLLLVTVLETIRVPDRAHPDPAHPDRAYADSDAVIRTAIAAHRTAHGGRGSGYDIATSAIGGAVRFAGGDAPRWEPSETVQRWREAEISLHSARGRAPVSSSRAVERFDHHVPVATERERAFLHANNELVDRIITATEWRELCSAVTEATRHGVTIGEQIGVTAALPFAASHTDDGWVAKASGAGNERSVFLVKADHRRPLPEGVRELALTTKGLRCDYLNL